MLKLTYCPEGTAYSDEEVERMLVLFHKLGVHIKTSTSNVIDAVKVLVAEGVIPSEDVQIYFNGKLLTINRFGAVSDYPRGFCDADYSRSCRTFKAAKAKRQGELNAKCNSDAK